MLRMNLKNSKIGPSEFSKLHRVEMILTVVVALGVVTLILLPELGL